MKQPRVHIHFFYLGITKLEGTPLALLSIILNFWIKIRHFSATRHLIWKITER